MMANQNQSQKEATIRSAWETKEERDSARAAQEAAALAELQERARQTRAEAEAARQNEIQQRMCVSAPILDIDW